MNEQEITTRILRRIREEYNAQIKPEDKITFEEFRTTCLSHLDIASYSQQNLKYYKIGEAGILVVVRKRLLLHFFQKWCVEVDFL